MTDREERGFPPLDEKIGGDVQMVKVEALLSSESLRSEGESEEHVRLLLSAHALLPPILVHRPSMRVIDGMHRLQVALRRGASEIPARFFEGEEEEAFILAVRCNTAHGLPLSLRDRTAAAERIIKNHPNQSDRSVANIAGLSPKTIAAIRRRTINENPQSNIRIGQDGRSRPLDASEGRLIASRLLKENPGSTLREVARMAGISVGTAHDVRDRLRLGEDPVPEHRRVSRRASRGAEKSEGLAPIHAKAVDQGTLVELEQRLQGLKRDPSLRFSESGRALLRLLDAQVLCAQRWDGVVKGIPLHCAEAITEVTAACSVLWGQMADQLRSRLESADH